VAVASLLPTPIDTGVGTPLSPGTQKTAGVPFSASPAATAALVPPAAAAPSGGRKRSARVGHLEHVLDLLDHDPHQGGHAG
jgi:hypothetical protein